ncbi:carbohydrate ABC transporter permease [Sanguibacter sp. HDW7]|uniref:carbohydrate ABC transporter permease n=1 Tax=Sanguibacter sp. HDW7 TaxID=2714931 RepID=UPI00140B02C1|nr:sugar ABC transporter permease [Sanguibacter sp. HDW7]QIK84460.1 sugar ABC transporter permease [Sanguibacter sp. HDW7]
MTLTVDTPPAARGPLTAARPGSTRPDGTLRRNAGLVLALPAVLWFLVFTVGPLVSLFYFAQTSWRGLIAPRMFVGGENFAKLVRDPVFHEAARNSLVQLLVVLPVVVVVAFMIAYYVSLRPRGHRIVRAVLFTPVLLSAPALAMVFAGVFAPSGLVNGALDIVGLGHLTAPWLARADTAFVAIIIVMLWSSVSVSAVMLASSLNTLPGEILEAAELDGCGHWRRMWLVAFPMCKEFVGVVTTLQFLWTLFSSAAVVLLLTRGGPGTATVNLSFLVYDYAFNQSKVGYSQAIAVMLFGAGVVGLLVIRRVFRAQH